MKMNFDISTKKESNKILYGFIFTLILLLIIATILLFHNYIDLFSEILYNKILINLAPIFETFIIIEELMNIYLQEDFIYLIIIAFIFNYYNIYKALLLIFNLSLTKILESFWIIIFLNKQMLNKYEDISHNLFSLLVFLITLTNIIKTKKKSYCNKLIIILIYFYILITIFYKIYNKNNNTLSYILFFTILSFDYYFLIFKIFLIDTNDKEQFIKIINYPIFKYLCIECMILFIYFGLGFKNEGVIFRSKEKISFIFAFIFSLLGIKLELKLQFKNAELNFLEFNFDQKGLNEIGEIEGNHQNETLLSNQITITKALKWNKTNHFIGFCRFIILILLLILPYIAIQSLTTFIKIQNHDDLVVILKYIISYSIIGFNPWYIYKNILKYLKLTNITYFFVEKESF